MFRRPATIRRRAGSDSPAHPTTARRRSYQPESPAGWTAHSRCYPKRRPRHRIARPGCADHPPPPARIALLAASGGCCTDRNCCHPRQRVRRRNARRGSGATHRKSLCRSIQREGSAPVSDRSSPTSTAYHRRATSAPRSHPRGSAPQYDREESAGRWPSRGGMELGPTTRPRHPTGVPCRGIGPQKPAGSAFLVAAPAEPVDLYTRRTPNRPPSHRTTMPSHGSRPEIRTRTGDLLAAQAACTGHGSRFPSHARTTARLPLSLQLHQCSWHSWPQLAEQTRQDRNSSSTRRGSHPEQEQARWRPATGRETWSRLSS